MKKLTLTNQDVLNMDAALTIAGKIKAKPDFSMKIAFNRQILKTHIKALEAASEASDGMQEFEKARSELITEMGEQVTHGDQVMTQVKAENTDAFEKKVTTLRKKYKKDIDEYDAQIKNFNEVVLPGNANDGEPIELHELPKNLPNGLEGNVLFTLIDLVKQPTK